MPKQSIQIDLTTDRRTIIERPVHNQVEIDGVTYAEVTINEQSLRVRRLRNINQWRICDERGEFVTIKFQPTFR